MNGQVSKVTVLEFSDVRTDEVRDSLVEISTTMLKNSELSFGAREVEWNREAGILLVKFWAVMSSTWNLPDRSEPTRLPYGSSKKQFEQSNQGERQ